MKILITTEWYRPTVNGVVISVVNLEEELRRQGHQVKVLTLSDSLKSRKEGDTYYISSLGFDKVYPGARASFRLRHLYLKELLAWRPDVIHTQCEFSTWLFARYLARKGGIPIVHTYHTVYEDYTHYFCPNERLGRSAVARFTRVILEHVQAAIVPTAKVETLLKGYGVKTTIYNVPTGIDLSRFQAALPQSEREQMRKELGLSPDRPVLVMVGRLAKEKNIEELLQLLAEEEGKAYQFLVVGDGPNRSHLENLVSQLGIKDRVIFTGMVKPEFVASYYKLGDVFVSASSSETQGLTYVEALASGLPAICKKDSCLEGVILEGENGWQYTDKESFYKALDTLFASPEGYGKIAARASEHAGLFSKEHFGSKVAEIYQEVIERYAEKQISSTEKMDESGHHLRRLAYNAFRFVRHS